MVRITSIKVILKFLKEKKIKNMKKWSDRKDLEYKTKTPLRQNLIANIRSLLENISGNNIVEMIKSIKLLQLSF